MGGLSAEREVSLQTGTAVAAGLRTLGYTVVDIDWTSGDSLPDLLTSAAIDVVWNALHGTLGEDGAVQGLCACMGVPCTGSGILASALAMDKIASKRIFESRNLPTPRWLVLDEQSGDPVEAIAAFGLPAVIKPANDGSSVGVTIVHDAADIAAAIASARACAGPTLVEEFIAGREIQVGILHGQILGSVEIRPKEGFYDYDAKYIRDDTEYLVPPPCAPEILERIEHLGLAAHLSLGAAAHGRTDLMLRPDGAAFILEVNTLPGMTSHSLLPKIAAARGLSFAKLCEAILLSKDRPE